MNLKTWFKTDRYIESQHRTKCTACNWVSRWYSEEWEADNAWYYHKRNHHYG